MMEVKTILVLNMGMKSIRSMIFDSDGNKLASFAVPMETSLTGDAVTQMPFEWWEKACRVIGETVADIGHRIVDYVTVTTSSSCLVCVDRDGEALLPCMMVSDRRAKREGDVLERAKAFPKVKQVTGLGADLSLMIPKALWVKEHESQALARTYKLL